LKPQHFASKVAVRDGFLLLMNPSNGGSARRRD